MRLEPKKVISGNMYGREEAIRNLRCIQPPMGCDKEITKREFLVYDQLSKKEYMLSGTCKSCQDKLFGECFPGCGHDSIGECTCEWEPCCSVDVGIGLITCGEQHKPACPTHDFPVEYDPDMREDDPPIDASEIEWSHY